MWSQKWEPIKDELPVELQADYMKIGACALNDSVYVFDCDKILRLSDAYSYAPLWKQIGLPTII